MNWILLAILYGLFYALGSFGVSYLFGKFAYFGSKEKEEEEEKGEEDHV